MGIGKKVFSMILAASTSLVMTTPISNAATEKYDLSYLSNPDTTSWTQLVNNTKGSLNEVDPNYFGISATGDLQMNANYQQDFVSTMHQQGSKVIPFISAADASTAAQAMTNRKKLAQEIASAIQQDSFDGVNVDIEGLDETNRDQYTDFIRELRAQIGTGKTISVAVAANPYGVKTGWNASYDYNTLAQLSDFLTIMAYDEHYQDDPTEGPVASLPFVEDSIKYALSQGVASSKLVLSVPFYGRLWKTDAASTADGDGFNGIPIAMFRDQKIMDDLKVKPTYDTTLGTNRLTFTIPQGQTYMINTTQLPSGTYDLFFDDARSLQAKLDLVKKYNLKGVASWSLYQESSDTWSYFNVWLKSDYFKDVPSGYWAQEAIQNMSYKNWINGTGPNQFGPTQALTRVQAASILVRALGLSDVTPTSYVFKDIPNSDAWGRNAIEVAREYGIIHGETATAFDPDGKLTREELAVMLQNIFKFSVANPVNKPFQDVDPNRTWSYQAIVAMHENGIINGFEDGKFHPLQISLREQMAALMYKLMPQFEAKQGKLEPINK